MKLHELFSSRHALSERDLLTAIFEGQVLIMAQIDDLVSGLQALQTDIENLEQELQIAQQVESPDLSQALDIVSSMRSKLENASSTAQTTNTDTATAASSSDQPDTETATTTDQSQS